MTTPVTAIVIVRNEVKHLGRCLPALSWADELIVIDMASTDGSLELARGHADRVLRVEPQPIAEPTRAAAARLAKHDWILLVDPDEVIPASLAAQVREAIVSEPDAGAFSLPMRFYFKGERLDGTVWGTLTYKQRLIHRERCDVLPWANRLTRVREGQRDVRIAWDGTNHMEHYWSDSYFELLRRHLTRYAHTEAKALAGNGLRFTLRRALTHPFVELYRSLRHFDGWRIGLRGWLLSGIYFVYMVASEWLVAFYQGRSKPDENAEMRELPVLRDDEASGVRLAA
ncbi:glycosyltransferase family 2 protein [Mucisphaera calidilacus]|uniref:Glycosyl transferase family 2 n=1 Tax=Mucisphaera calidilacus TaxID=2527982 RepID=A0A518BZ19_9BACT|nr:glycosyltransferase family 2 protein [Mucisphaera calidilacus]QDU72221.1 Glycosyl transferase family 2 [Mucisphaera calidilacus]